MSDSDSSHRQAVALFRYGVIADLVHASTDRTGITAQLRAKASKDYVIPGSRRTRTVGAGHPACARQQPKGPDPPRSVP